MLTELSKTKAAIFGFSKAELTAEEIKFFSEVKPFGFIVFKRNIENPTQLKKLSAALREITGNEKTPILIDQEGGKVARLTPPYWRNSPPCNIFAEIAETSAEQASESLYLNTQIISSELASCGINVNCAPVADLSIKGAHDIIGDRAFGTTPEQVSYLARTMCNAFLDSGVIPIIKHIPGHGRANSDSHESLPIVNESLEVLEQTDFKVFKNLNDMPWAMTAHIKYTCLDEKLPSTLSKKVMDYIRKEIGFNGLIITDDLSMKALDNSFAFRTQKSIEAGCDIVLHCNGDMKEMQEIAQATPLISEKSINRYIKGNLALKQPGEYNIPEMEKQLFKISGWDALKKSVA